MPLTWLDGVLTYRCCLGQSLAVPLASCRGPGAETPRVRSESTPPPPPPLPGRPPPQAPSNPSPPGHRSPFPRGVPGAAYAAERVTGLHSAWAAHRVQNITKPLAEKRPRFVTWHRKSLKCCMPFTKTLIMPAGNSRNAPYLCCVVIEFEALLILFVFTGYTQMHCQIKTTLDG